MNHHSELAFAFWRFLVVKTIAMFPGVRGGTKSTEFTSINKKHRPGNLSGTQMGDNIPIPSMYGIFT